MKAFCFETFKPILEKKQKEKVLGSRLDILKGGTGDWCFLFIACLLVDIFDHMHVSFCLHADLCPALHLMDCCPPGFSVKFSRKEYWNRLLFPSPGNLPHPNIESISLTPLALAVGFFTSCATREASCIILVKIDFKI